MAKMFLASVGATLLLSGAALAGTLDDVKARGKLNCGVSSGTAFSAPDANGVWKGFDVAFCRAVAAAVLKDPMAVTFIPTTGQTRFTALSSGEIDMLSRSTTWTLSRDADLGMSFAGVNYYDGQGFMVPKELGATSAKDLDGATICILTGTTTELNLSEYFRSNGMTYEPVPVESSAEGQRQYLGHACDVFTSDGANLAAMRASFEKPDDHIILPELVSKEPLGPVVRQGDDQWADIVRWTMNALVAGEEFGVTKANADQMATETQNPEVKRLLGADAEVGKGLGLDAEWAKRAITAGGNYGEIFATNIGADTPIKLQRGQNALSTNGGLMYALPFR